MSDPAADVRELLPRALRFIADIILARVDDKGTHGWLMMAAGEIESLRDEVVRLKGTPVAPFCAECDRQERARLAIGASYANCGLCAGKEAL